MGAQSARNAKFTFTGRYDGTEGDEHATLVGVGGSAYVGGGDDTVTVFSAYVKINDTTGNLTVSGASGGITINKTNYGNIDYTGVSAYNSITHAGSWGDVTIRSLSAYSEFYRSGNGRGSIKFYGASFGVKAVNTVSGFGDIIYRGGGLKNELTRHSDSSESSGNINFAGVGGENILINTVHSGSIIFHGAGLRNVLKRLKGKTEESEDALSLLSTIEGYKDRIRALKDMAPTFNDLPMSIRTKIVLIERDLFRAEQNYESTRSRGNIRMTGAGGSNEIYSDVHRGNIYFSGIGASNQITHEGNYGNITFRGGVGILNIVRTKASGNVDFRGTGAANIVVHEGRTGDLFFRGTGFANIIVRRGDGDMRLFALGGANVIYFEGDGNTRAFLFGGANIFVHTGDGDSLLGMAGIANIIVEAGNGNLTTFAVGAANVVTKIGNGDLVFAGVGGTNVVTQIGYGNLLAVAFGGANIITKVGGGGNVTVGLLGGANIVTHVGMGDVTAVMAGGANILTKVGTGDVLAVMFGGTNVLTQVGGVGSMTAVMAGGANIVTKVGHGSLTAFLAGVGNIVTHVGSGNLVAVTLGGANVVTKVGSGDVTAVMIGGGNAFTQVDTEGDGGRSIVVAMSAGNVLTKAADGDFWAFAGGKFNIITHVGDGMTVAAMIAEGNILTKVGDGTTIGLMVGTGNVFTHVGDGLTVAAMVGQGNIFTKVGGTDTDITAALMVGQVGIFTHVGNGITAALMLGRANVFTKVGDGLTIAAMAGQVGIYTHVGDGTSVAAMIGRANIFTKVGTGTTIAVMKARANIMTHVGDGLTVGAMLGDANVLTKVGDGTTVALAHGKANVITHVGDGMLVAGSWAKANIITAVGNTHMVALVKGDLNVVTSVDYSTITVSGVTKARPGARWSAEPIPSQDVESGQQGDGIRPLLSGKTGGAGNKRGRGFFDSVETGDEGGGDWQNQFDMNGYEHGKDDATVQPVPSNHNSLFHADDFTAGVDFTAGSHMAVVAHGKINVITKVGDGMQLVGVKGDTNIVTHVGRGLTAVAAVGKANVITKVGDGMSIALMKGDVNVATHVGQGGMIAVGRGNANIMSKIGGGASVMAASGRFNLAVKYGDGFHAGLMWGDNNVNVQVGDGLSVFAAYGQRNFSIKVGDGDFYGLMVATARDGAISASRKQGGASPDLVASNGAQAADVARDLGMRRDEVVAGVVTGLGAATVVGGGVAQILDDKDSFESLAETSDNPNVEDGLSTPEWDGKEVQDTTTDTTDRSFNNQKVGNEGSGKKKTTKAANQATTAEKQQKRKVSAGVTQTEQVSEDTKTAMDGSATASETEANRISDSGKSDKAIETGETAKTSGEQQKDQLKNLFATMQDSTKAAVETTTTGHLSSTKETTVGEPSSTPPSESGAAGHLTGLGSSLADVHQKVAKESAEEEKTKAETKKKDGETKKEDAEAEEKKRRDEAASANTKALAAEKDAESQKNKATSNSDKAQEDATDAKKRAENNGQTAENDGNGVKQKSKTTAGNAEDGNNDRVDKDGKKKEGALHTSAELDRGKQKTQTSHAPSGTDTDPTTGKKITTSTSGMNEHGGANEEKVKEQGENSGKKSRQMAANRNGKTVSSKLVGNVSINIGDGNANVVMLGSTNISVKVGNGGYKTISYGDNNVHVRVGDADNTSQAVTIGGYRALEGLAMLIGKRNLMFNHGVSNDLIVAIDPSVGSVLPDNPFKAGEDGVSKVPFAGFSFMKDIIGLGQGGDASKKTKWRQAQDDLYKNPKTALSMFNKKKRAATSEELKNEAVEAREGLTKLSLAETIRQTPKTGNVIVGGQGADVIVAIGNMNIIFSDTVMSLLDTNIAALFDIKHQVPGLSTALASTDPESTRRNAGATLTKWFEKGGLDLWGMLPNINMGQLIGVTYGANGTPTSQSSGISHLTEMGKMVLGLMGFNVTIPGMHMYGDTSGLIRTAMAGVTQGALESADAFFANSFFKGFLGFGVDGASASQGQGDNTPPPPAGTPTYGENLFTGDHVSLMPPAIGKLPSADALYSLFGNLKTFVAWAAGGDKANIENHFRSLGFLDGDGDLVVSAGKLNAAWTGHGDDVAMLVGDWNRLFAGSGNDIGLLVGNNNAFAGGQGSDIAILIGQENLFFGDEGDSFKAMGYETGRDACFAFGNNNKLVGGDGRDILFAYGDNNNLSGGAGEDIMIAIGNTNRLVSGGGDDFILAFGAHNTYEMGGGADYIINFGNVSVSYGGGGSDFLKLAGSGNRQLGGDDNDFMVIAGDASSSTLEGGAGDDTIVVGGTDSSISGGDGADRFIVRSDHGGSAVIGDAGNDDWIMLGEVSADTTDKLGDFWFERSDDDLVIRSGDDRSGTTTVSDYFGDGKDIKLVGHWWKQDTGNEPAERSDDGKPSIWTESHGYRALDRQGVSKMLEAMSAVSAAGYSTAGVRAVRKTLATHQITGSDLGVLRSSEYTA